MFSSSPQTNYTPQIKGFCLPIFCALIRLYGALSQNKKKKTRGESSLWRRYMLNEVYCNFIFFQLLLCIFGFCQRKRGKRRLPACVIVLKWWLQLGRVNLFSRATNTTASFRAEFNLIQSNLLMNDLVLDEFPQECSTTKSPWTRDKTASNTTEKICVHPGKNESQTHEKLNNHAVGHLYDKDKTAQIKANHAMCACHCSSKWQCQKFFVLWGVKVKVKS